MKRRPLHTRHRPSRDSDRLIWLAQGLTDSGSRLEDAWWEGELSALIEKLLRGGDEDALNQALDRLHETNPRAYDELADMIEAGCEINRGDGVGRLVIALPVLAWSRYSIATRSLPAATLDALRAQLHGHVLAAGAKVAFADYLFSPDQMPQGYGDTHALAEDLWQAAAAGKDLKVDARHLPESQSFVSDVRYLLACVEVPAGQPVFRWNEPDGSREAAELAWTNQGGALLQGLLTGCTLQALLPDAYFAAWRKADRETRGFALKSAAAYLQTLFSIPASHIHAVAAPYFDRFLEEWRVGFSVGDDPQVVHGVTWPLMEQDEEQADIAAQIEALLKEAGVIDVRILDTRMPLEYCDDCGAPLFPNADGENIHTELPEDMQDTPAHLH
ncbi:MAG: DUF2863 family protein [Betaproteobacteria bacterium]|nr:DUF2863 family protein [Betaproteobacteria bacterium]